MPRFIITYCNKNGEIFSQRVYALNQVHALEKLKLDNFEILAITKLSKKLGDKL